MAFKCRHHGHNRRAMKKLDCLLDGVKRKWDARMRGHDDNVWLNSQKTSSHPRRRVSHLISSVRNSCFVVAGLTCHLVSVAMATETMPVSLFFTPEEVQAIEILKNPHTEAPSAVADSGDVHLGAVFYYGPGDWALWLAGRFWTPLTEQADLHVIEVTPGEVRFSLAEAADKPSREVTLKPYQTYRPSTGEVFEGSPSLASNLSR
jgi:hypothetical protein